MGKINFINVYNDRLEEIKKQMKKAAIKKDWNNYYILKAEKENLKSKLNNMMNRRTFDGR